MRAGLPHFDKLNVERATLFLGNGASMNICSDFGYPSLFRAADLSAHGEHLFSEFDTHMFESVLERLRTAERVSKVLGLPKRNQSGIAAEYSNVKEALFDAVNLMHIRHDEISRAILLAVSDHLLEYTSVFTTNYDLLAYWSLMARNDFRGFTDFFLPDDRTDGALIFDLTRRMSRGRRMQMFHLHGGLHLWYDEASGLSGKWARDEAGSLLDLVKAYGEYPDRHPLLISEGTAEDKMRAIRRSDYLSFALRRLALDNGDLVIFGSRFGSQDQHISDAINDGKPRHIAISLRANRDPSELRLAKADLAHRFSRHHVSFFDAATHPLGRSNLTVR